MYRLHNYTSTIEAQQVVNWLLSHGVLAAIVDSHSSTLGPIAGFISRYGQGQVTVAIAYERQRDEAEILLELLADEPAEYESGWEHQSVPDLSLLDPAMLPPCPGCGVTLGAVERCAACGVAVDVLSLIIERHGPEAIEPLIELDQGAGSGVSDETLERAAADCPGCGSPLDGLPVTGTCPNCTVAYNKRTLYEAILEGRIGR